MTQINETEHASIAEETFLLCYSLLGPRQGGAHRNPTGESRDWVTRTDLSMVAQAGGRSTINLRTEGENMDIKTIDLILDYITVQVGTEDHLLDREEQEQDDNNGVRGMDRA